MISPRPPAGPARRRAAFTLVEILLVIAVLAVMAGVVWPGVWRFVGEMRLREGADNARLNLAATRMRAMEGGEAYRWFCQPGGRWYAALPKTPRRKARPRRTRPDRTKLLVLRPSPLGDGWQSCPKGGVRCRFAGWCAAANGADHAAGRDDRSRADRRRGHVGRVARFQSDGSSRGARLVVADAEGRTVTVDIRPLTGAATLGQVEFAVDRSPRLPSVAASRALPEGERRRGLSLLEVPARLGDLSRGDDGAVAVDRERRASLVASEARDRSDLAVRIEIGGDRGGCRGVPVGLGDSFSRRRGLGGVRHWYRATTTCCTRSKFSWRRKGREMAVYATL